MSYSRRLFALILVGLLFVAAELERPTQAQVSSRPALRITKVDASSFPDVALYVSGSNIGADLGTLPFTVLEDGEERESVGETRPVALQIALVLDASGSVLDPGLTNNPRYLEVGSAARRLITQGVLSTDSDWLASYAIGPDRQVTPVSDWTRDHQAVADSLYIYQPPSDIEQTTPLNDYIFFALDSFDTPDVADNAARAIVLFSDGETGSSSLQLDDAVNKAAALNVPIYTVLLGPGTPSGLANMDRIATLTGGRAFQLSSEESLDGMWEQIVPMRNQQVLAYRSERANPREVMIAATLPNGTSVRAASAFPAISVQPVEVAILSPTPDTLIERSALTHDTPLVEVNPVEMEIESELFWPQGSNERFVERVEYIVGDVTEVQTDIPFGSTTLDFRFPIRSFNSGAYTLRVRAIDELGMVSESEPVTIQVSVLRPEPPRPSVSLGPLGTVAVDTLRTAASLGGLLLGVLAVILAARNPRVREVAANTVGWVQEKTERFHRGGKRDSIKALLTVETNNGNLPPQLHISSDVTTIGRDPSLSTLVLNHPQVSRLHCKILRQADNTLRIEDAGGSTGTFVNDQAVSVDGMTLYSGDLIEIGPVHLRFYYKDDDMNAATMEDPNRTIPVAARNAS